jgi:carbamate kinase
VESEIISLLVQTGCVVIAVGGGGIPVVEDGHGELKGVAAVIDKDAATAVLAGQIRANSLVISTSVPRVFLNFGLPNQRQLDTLTAGEARTLLPHFHAGSMLPKVEACLDFLAAGGEAAFITCPADISAALRGTAGTRIVR